MHLSSTPGRSKPMHAIDAALQYVLLHSTNTRATYGGLTSSRGSAHFCCTYKTRFWSMTNLTRGQIRRSKNCNFMTGPDLTLTCESLTFIFVWGKVCHDHRRQASWVHPLFRQESHSVVDMFGISRTNASRFSCTTIVLAERRSNSLGFFGFTTYCKFFYPFWDLR